jgi:diacylglycerol kinase (ATP)
MKDPAAEPKELRRPFGWKERMRSFRHAIRGIVRLVRTQHNVRIHAVAALAVAGAALGLHVSAGDWCWIILAIAMVWTAEAFNTALEFLADAASPDYHPLVREAKDIAAGAVLVTAVAAAIIGGIILWPHIMNALVP